MTKYEMLGNLIIIYDIHPDCLARKLGWSYDTLMRHIKLSCLVPPLIEVIQKMHKEKIPKDSKYLLQLTMSISIALNEIESFSELKKPSANFWQQYGEFISKYQYIKEKTSKLKEDESNELIFRYAYTYRLTPRKLQKMNLPITDILQRIGSPERNYKEERIHCLEIEERKRLDCEQSNILKELKKNKGGNRK